MKKMVLSGVMTLALCAMAPVAVFAQEEESVAAATCTIQLHPSDSFTIPANWLTLTGCSTTTQFVYVVTNEWASPFGLVCIVAKPNNSFDVNVFLDENNIYKPCTGPVIDAAEAMIRAHNPDAQTNVTVTYLPLL